MSSNSNKQYVLHWLTTQNVIVKPISTLSVMYITYGVYIIIFGLSIHVLAKRKSTVSPSKLYMWCTVSLFALNTVGVAVNSLGYIHQAIVEFEALKAEDWDGLRQYLRRDTTKTVWIMMANAVIILMNAIADCMLIHRCYVVWASRKVVLLPLAALSFAINGTLIGTYFPVILNLSRRTSKVFQTANNVSSGALIAAAAFNFLLTFLTAGRILWISREARRSMGSHVKSRYNTMVAVITESGILYSTVLLTYTILTMTLDPQGGGLIPVDLSMLSTQLSGLAPTLIIVRVAYNKSVNSVDQMTSTLRFAEGPGKQQDPDPLTTTIEIRGKYTTGLDSVQSDSVGEKVV
ncbi:hypothetical protein PQX77_017259 [Marasmius sp. AFHP31]|nr:hypothetical protein PQX77_017259 [Marasmius sp. AFHP31]